MLLICLDLQPARLWGEPAAERQRRVASARRVIERARGAGWEVAHVCRMDIAGSATPMPGLGPLPSEAVYRRQGASAFEAQHFAAFMQRRSGSMAILGFDAGCEALATALSAADLGHRVTVLTDAAGETPVLDAARDLVASVRHGGVRLARLQDLTAWDEPRLLMAANQP
jgi:nicotinamidase-related amidase